MPPSLQTECTRNEFRFTCWKSVCSEIQDTGAGTTTEGDAVQLKDNVDVGVNEGTEEQTVLRPDPLKFKVQVQSWNFSEDPLTPLDVNEDLLDISQEDPAVLACGNVVPEEEVCHQTLIWLNF